MMRVTIALLLVAVLPAPAAAETAYVTDQLRLGLHQAADTSDRAFRTLDSGQQLEVLSRDRNYARVRLPDGTTGHVKAAYLVTEKPAALIVAEARAETERLRGELAAATRRFAGPAAAIAALEQQVAEQLAELEESRSQIAELAAQNARYAERQERYRHSLPLTWVAGALGACLVAGFLGGLWWLDYRSRRRHGGFRIY